MALATIPTLSEIIRSFATPTGVEITNTPDATHSLIIKGPESSREDTNKASTLL